MKKLTVAALLLGLASFATESRAADIEVSNAFMRAAPVAGGTGAAFMTIVNHGGADRLISAEADISKSVELHTHVKDGDVYRMRKVDALAVAEHGSAELKPGGDHIMFIGLNAPVKEGTKVPLTLKFEKAGSIVVQLPVQGAGAMAPAAGMMPGAGMMHGGPGH
ncbi:MAG: copper chaperone PCu(A)C [Magnetospirillum sp.]|nr:copper chaperone PCu(A)C [Magnetospirillum sp.]MBI3707996.1 copper chaperone PCu(A)C [Pseudomonadota bacterium]